jgi:hypothetical protein
VRGPHFGCNGLGLERTRCLFEELDQPFHTPIRGGFQCLTDCLSNSVLAGRCATAY